MLNCGVMTNMPIIKMGGVRSVYETDAEVLHAISSLYLDDETFELDPTYSRGEFYKDFPIPKHIGDLDAPGVVKMDSTNLPFKDVSLQSIIFDPPFMFGTHGQTKNNAMNKRFTMFDTFDELEVMYKASLKEFYRVLRKNGILAFKCQDYTDSKTTLTHCLVYNWAVEANFRVEDILIRVFVNGHKYNPYLTQRHAKKDHCYYFVFRG